MLFIYYIKTLTLIIVVIITVTIFIIIAVLLKQIVALALRLVRPSMELVYTFTRSQQLVTVFILSQITLFHLMMGLESVPETLYFLNHLTRLEAREDIIRQIQLI
jgi:hypothetical protein